MKKVIVIFNKIDQEIINDQNIYSMDSFLSEGLIVNN